MEIHIIYRSSNNMHWRIYQHVIIRFYMRCGFSFSLVKNSNFDYKFPFFRIFEFEKFVMNRFIMFKNILSNTIVYTFRLNYYISMEGKRICWIFCPFSFFLFLIRYLFYQILFFQWNYFIFLLKWIIFCNEKIKKLIRIKPKN